MPSPLARTQIALDPGRVVRPRATLDPDQPDAVCDWLAHLEAGRLVHAPRALASPDGHTDAYPAAPPPPKKNAASVNLVST